MKFSFEGSPEELAQIVVLLLGQHGYSSSRPISLSVEDEENADITRPIVQTQPVKVETSPVPPDLVDHTVPEVPSLVADAVAQMQAQLPEIEPSRMDAAINYFNYMCRKWRVNWNTEGTQPDRLALMSEFAESKHLLPILVQAYRRLSLQSLVADALRDGTEKIDPVAWIELSDAIAANMVAVSHKACPELAGTYDYTNRWKGGMHA